MGFCTAFGGYLEGKFAVLEELKDEGCDLLDISGRLFDVHADSGSTWSVPFCCPLIPNDLSLQVHPVPSFHNLTTFDLMVEKMEELGLWVMYDMRR